MNENERLDYLIKVLEGNNARVFAEKTGIRTDSLSRARKGINHPSSYFERILSTYPDVSREWLYNGVGVPLISMREKSEILLKLESLEKDVKRLMEMVGSLAGNGL